MISYTYTHTHTRIWLALNRPGPHTRTQEWGMGNGDEGSGEGTALWFLRGRATVGGSGCDLDTVWHTAFLMGHFDHCHSLYPRLGCCRMPQTQKNNNSAFSKHSIRSLLSSFNDGNRDGGCGGATAGWKKKKKGNLNFGIAIQNTQGSESFTDNSLVMW